MSDSTADILRRARDHIAKPGMWWQGGGYSPNAAADLRGAVTGEPCCAVGALYWALGATSTIPWDALLVLERTADMAVDTFNDTPGRTQAEVVALFDRAITLAEKDPDHV